MSDFSHSQKAFKQEFDVVLEEFLRESWERFPTSDVLLSESRSQLMALALSGGKRLRPWLLVQGYLAAGGTYGPDVLRAAVSVELTHLYLLIHDDIIDRDTTRHGVATLHTHFTDFAQRHFPSSDTVHFGSAMAIVLGDMTSALANEALFTSTLAPERIIAALTELQQVVEQTVVGQMHDVEYAYRGLASSSEVLQMYIEKTAKYSFEGPLHTGVLLAGGDTALLEQLSAAALPLGQAFQIQDDILGTFGDTAATGKGNSSDLVEGKLTYMVALAFEMATAEQRQELKRLLYLHGAVTPSDHQQFCAILTQCGAYSAAQARVQELRIEAEKRAQGLPEGIRRWYQDFIPYIMGRTV